MLVNPAYKYFWHHIELKNKYIYFFTCLPFWECLTVIPEALGASHIISAI